MSLLGEAWDLLRKYGDIIGVDWDGAPGPLDKSGAASELFSFASSPILAGAQVVIQGMKLTTGSGEPQTGEAFETSAKLYDDAANVLIQTEVQDPAQWDGTAATAYEQKDRTHRHQTFEVAEAETNMRKHLSELGGQVKDTRQTLDDRFNFLSDYDTVTSWMNAIPGGAAVKAAADMAVASTQIEWANVSMAKLLATSVLNASRIRDEVETYANTAAQELFGNVPCGEPFGDERTAGTLPTRVDPNAPYQPPYQAGPPVLEPK
jgi:hypothetical protein